MNKLNKILRLPEKIPCDKRLHCMIGVVLIAIMLLITSSITILSITLIAVSYGIEYYQKWTKSGHFDHYDALAVMLGGATILVPLIIIGVLK